MGQNGTPHFQGYIEFNKPMTMGMIKKILGQEVHLEPRYGTREQAHDYCTKEDTAIEGPWEIGQWNPLEKGKRNDLLNLKNDIDNNNFSMGQIADNYFGSFIRYGRGIREYMHLRGATKRSHKTETYVFIGPPGTGKSKTAAEWGGENAYWLPRSIGGVWFDGYDGQDTTIIDDFYGWVPYDMLLRIADRWPFLAPTKGGHVQFVSRYLIITSNKMPDLWYKRESIDFTAFLRRVEAFYYFHDKDFEYPPERFETHEAMRKFHEEQF